MSDGPRVDLSLAEVIAMDLAAAIKPAVLRASVVGSVRRGEPTVGDLELLVVPRIELAPDPASLFPDVQVRLNRLDQRVDALVANPQSPLGFRTPKRNGSKYKALTWDEYGEPFHIDLFAVIEPAQWGVLSLIRTGPEAFAKRLVTPRTMGGLCPPFLHFTEGHLERYDDRATVIETPDEASVFQALGVPFIPLEDRA